MLYVWNSEVFIDENAFENVVCKMTTILSGYQYVKDMKGVWLVASIMSTRRHARFDNG